MAQELIAMAKVDSNKKLKSCDNISAIIITLTRGVERL